MSEEIVKQEMSIDRIVGNVQRIQQAMKDVMKRGTHYDVVPGCGKKLSLLKPGAEVIMSMFRLGGEVIVDEKSDGYDIDYTITVRGFHIPTGGTVGYGIGRGSTKEDKYAWREAVSDDEFDTTIPERRRIHYKKDLPPVKQVRQTPATIANTVLKMAKKRAMVDFCLTATACSDMFVQDMEECDNNGKEEPHYRQPQKKESAQNVPAEDSADIISEAQSKRLYAIAKGKKLSDEEISFIVFNIAGVNSSRQIPRSIYDAIIAEIDKSEPGKVINDSLKL